MFNKYSLYINAIKSNTSLKLDYKKLENNQILESNQSTFMSKNEILPRDVIHKLNASQKDVEETYISTLLIGESSKLIKKQDAKRLKDYSTTSLNSDLDVAIAKNKLFETKHYFESSGIDYIYSAFHILNLHIEKNSCTNSLVTLFYNNQTFIVILNGKGEIVFNKIVNLTTFENIKNCKFYDSDVIGQKLFDEVHALEVTDTINSVINEFYEITNNIFIEEIILLYTVKQLNDEQVGQIGEELMLDISYHPVSIEEELFELARDKHQIKSFTKARTKPTKSYTKIILSLLSIIIFALLIYLIAPFDKFMSNKKEEVLKKTITVKKEFNLPNHIEKNNLIKNRVQEILTLIPYDVLLKEFELSKNSLKLTANFLKDDIYLTILEPELKKIYENSNITYTEPRSTILEGTIFNEGIKPLKPSLKAYNETYITDEFIPILRVTEQLKTLFPKDAIINFKSSFKSDVVTFNYLVNIVLQSPTQFYTILEMLNNELYSINVSYPVLLIKTDIGLEVEFILQFHQPK